MLLVAFLSATTLMMGQVGVKKTTSQTVSNDITKNPVDRKVDVKNAPQKISKNGGENEVGTRTPRKGVGPAPPPKKDPAALNKINVKHQ